MPRLKLVLMMLPHTDPTKRFSDRVEAYVRFRPTYPKRVLELLEEETGLTTASVIADVGSGTGILSRLFLDNGNTVFAIEPNPDMRGAAEVALSCYPLFYSISARAEATTLPSHSVDYVVAGQAFHWFDIEISAREFARILRLPGWVVLLWNRRRSDSSPFLRSYEALLQKYGTDYYQIQHRNLDHHALRTFFAKGVFELHRVYNEQRLNLEGLQGRLLSSSYVPTAEHPQFLAMIDDLETLFRRHEDQDQVVFEYDTEIYFGHLA
jgi:SAM-dependent methyltransferase